MRASSNDRHFESLQASEIRLPTDTARVLSTAEIPNVRLSHHNLVTRFVRHFSSPLRCRAPSRAGSSFPRIYWSTCTYGNVWKCGKSVSETAWRFLPERFPLFWPLVPRGSRTKNRETENGYLGRDSRIPAGVRCVIFQLMSLVVPCVRACVPACVRACVRASICTYARAHARTLAHENLAYTRKGETLRSDLYPQSCQLSEPTRQNRCRHGSRTRSSPLHPSPHLHHSPLFRSPLAAPVLSRLVSLSLSLSLSLSPSPFLSPCPARRSCALNSAASPSFCVPQPIPRPVDLAIEEPIVLSSREHLPLSPTERIHLILRHRNSDPRDPRARVQRSRGSAEAAAAVAAAVAGSEYAREGRECARAWCGARCRDSVRRESFVVVQERSASQCASTPANVRVKPSACSRTAADRGRSDDHWRIRTSVAASARPRCWKLQS